LVSLSRLKSGWISKYILTGVLSNVIKTFICNETLLCFKGCNGFTCSANNPGNFYRNILPSSSRVCRTFTLHHFVLYVPTKKLSAESISLQQYHPK
jgi:hypothetical protein